MLQYYLVIGAFVVICVGAVLYVMLNPKKSFAQMPVIDESQNLCTMVRLALTSNKKPPLSSQ